MSQFKIGDEVVIYGRGRIRAMEEEYFWDPQTKQGANRIKFTVDYPDSAGSARVTEAVIERANANAKD